MTAEKTFSGVTLHGFPVRIELEWPFHRSEGGSDWYVMHGTVRLEDGGPLHADIALNLAQTIKEVLPSLDSDLTFWDATPQQVEEFVARKVFWLSGSGRDPVMISDPCDAQYLGAAGSNMVDRLVAAAQSLAGRGMVELAGDYARATDGLLAQAQGFMAAKDHALEELHAKHAFERG